MKEQEQKQAQLKIPYYVYRSDFENTSIKKKNFFWCDLALLAVFIIFVLFCHHFIHLVLGEPWN
jgi:hypothetical protein